MTASMIKNQTNNYSLTFNNITYGQLVALINVLENDGKQISKDFVNEIYSSANEVLEVKFALDGDSGITRPSSALTSV